MSRWDDDLGRELRETPLPAHRPDHFERIRERLRASAGGEGGGRPPEPRPGDRRPGRRAFRPGLPGVRWAVVASAAAAVAAAVALTWAGVPGVERAAPPAATADTVLTRVQQALSGLTAISGDVVQFGSLRNRPYSHLVGSFTFTSKGDYRIVEADQATVTTYDADTRVARRYQLQNGRVLYCNAACSLPEPGALFSPWSGTPQVLDRSIAAYARAVIADLDPKVPVTPVVFEHRTAWQITVPDSLGGTGTQGSTRIVVDAESGFPLVVENWSPNGEVSGTRLENVRVGSLVSRPVLRLPTPAGGELTSIDEHFRRSSPAAALALGRRVAGYDPAGHGRPHEARQRAALVPLAARWVPKGFRLESITAGLNGSLIGTCKVIRPHEIESATVVLTYRRGFDRLSVVSRWREANTPGSDDPFYEDDVISRPSTLTPVQQGSLRGTQAHVVVGFTDWPHLYVVTGQARRVTICVAGDLTRAELLRVAGSLQPLTP